MARRRWSIILAVVLLCQWTAALAQLRQLHASPAGAWGAICSVHGEGDQGRPSDASRDKTVAAAFDCPACHQTPGVDGAFVPILVAAVRWTAIARPMPAGAGVGPLARAPPYPALAPPSV